MDVQNDKNEEMTKMTKMIKGLASYCKADTTFTFNFSIINA